MRGGERGERERRGWINIFFATSAKDFHTLPQMCILREKRVRHLAFMLSYLRFRTSFACNTVIKEKKNESFSISLRPFSFSRRMHIQCETRRTYINLYIYYVGIWSPVFKRSLKTSCKYPFNATSTEWSYSTVPIFYININIYSRIVNFIICCA